MAFAEWMVNVRASTSFGQLVIHGAEHSVDSTNDGAQSWIAGTDSQNGKPMVQYFSFNTPVEVAAAMFPLASRAAAPTARRRAAEMRAGTRSSNQSHF
jgi:hypothetical protein